MTFWSLLFQKNSSNVKNQRLKSNICTSRPPQNGPGVRVSVTDSRFCTKVLLDFLCNAWYTSTFLKNSQNIDVNFEDFVTNLYYSIWSLLATINIDFLNFQLSFSKYEQISSLLGFYCFHRLSNLITLSVGKQKRLFTCALLKRERGKQVLSVLDRV